MCKIDNLISTIDRLAKADEEELKEDLKEYIELDYTINKINELEGILNKLFKEQAKYYSNGLISYVEKASIAETMNYVKQNLTTADTFLKKFGSQFKKFLNITTEYLTNSFIKNIDTDLFFSIFTDRTTDWINSWSEELGNLIQEESVSTLNYIISNGLKNGDGIRDIAKNLKNSFGFSRTRARRIAITEVLTAHSHASYESSIQNPSVDRVMWKHSGDRGIEPRPHHVALDGTIIKKGEWFDVGMEKGRYPRDTALSAKERVNCHCLLQQILNDDVMGLTLEERQALQADAIANDNRLYHRKSNSKRK